MTITKTICIFCRLALMLDILDVLLSDVSAAGPKIKDAVEKLSAGYLDTISAQRYFA
jgi:hypothetical protein